MHLFMDTARLIGRMSSELEKIEMSDFLKIRWEREIPSKWGRLMPVGIHVYDQEVAL